MNQAFIYIMSLSKEINQLNEKLNSLADKYLDNPWAGVVLLFILFGFCWCGINSLGSKK